MTLQEVKDYLRVDHDDDDAIIQVMMAVAEDFIINACGQFDETKPRAKMVYLAAVQDLYDKRTLTSTSTQGYSVTSNLTFMMRSMLSQLQIEEFMESEDPEEEGS